MSANENSPNTTGSSRLARRAFMQAAAGAGIATGIAGGQDPMPAEESLEVYAWPLSCLPGEQVSLHVSTTCPAYSIEIARVGGRRKVVWARDSVAGAWHATPPEASAVGCSWPEAVTIPIGKNWSSGYYAVTLKARDKKGDPRQAEAFFVVRSDGTTNSKKILLQLSTNTYNAYNNWGGACLYQSGKTPLQSYRVSFERPFAPGFLTKPNNVLSIWSPYAGWHNWERGMMQWIERQGYAVDYCLNQDLQQFPDLLPRYRLMLSVGHDEYWSAGMRDAVERFVANGGNAAFFSGNVAYWQVRMEDEGRAMTCFKFSYEQDPFFKLGRYDQMTGLWSHRLTARPENQLTGVSFNYGGYHRFGSVPRGSGGYTIHRPKHWVFDGTNLQWGDQLGIKDQIVGYECDGCRYTMQDGLPVPTHQDGTPEGFEILGSAPARLWDSDLPFASASLFGDDNHREDFTHGAAVMGLYTRGGTVFTTGCTHWSRGLEGQDPIVERITHNLLLRLSG